MSILPDLTLHPLLISLLFSVAAAAFIGVLNARGVWRTVVASLLALFCLGAAVFHTARYRALDRAAAEAPVVLPAVESGFNVDDGGSQGIADADLRDLVALTRALRDSLAAEDPSRARSLSDSAYQAFENRADGYLARVRRLREGAARITAEPPVGMDEAVEYLNLALQPLAVAARDLKQFFHAENKDEERRLLESYRQNAENADTPLRQAESRAGSPSPESAP